MISILSFSKDSRCDCHKGTLSEGLPERFSGCGRKNVKLFESAHNLDPFVRRGTVFETVVEQRCPRSFRRDSLVAGRNDNQIKDSRTV